MTSHGARRSTSVFRVAASRRPHSQSRRWPVSRSRAFQIQSLCRFFEEMPHLVDFEDDGLPDGFRCGCVCHGNVSDPLQHGARMDAKHLRQRVHGEAVTIAEHGQRFLPEGSPTWRGACPLIATSPTEPALFAPSLPGLDHVRMRAFRTGVHASLPIALVTTNTIGKPMRISLLRQYSQNTFRPSDGVIDGGKHHCC